MAVTSACDPHDDAVTLNIQAGQRLRYEIIADDGIRFALRDHAGGTLLSSTKTQRVREWPQDGDAVLRVGDDVSHAVGMQFGEAGHLQWKIDLLSSNGVVIRQVKHCTYTDATGADDHFDDIRIFVS